MSWHERQSAFASALRDPEHRVPAGIAKSAQALSTKRFNVYRNNIAVSLTEVLAASFPVVRQLVGEEFFMGMAHAYAGAHPPKSPVMLAYGGDFAGYIAAFEPARSLPFLADVARVEWAWNTAYHAADCAPVAIPALQAVPPEVLGRVRLRLHPSLQILSSDWPAMSIWHCHQTGEDPASAMQQLEPRPECAIVVRPAYEVDVRLIPAAAWVFYVALHDGATLAEATEELAEADQADVAAMLQLLFTSGSVAEVIAGDGPARLQGSDRCLPLEPQGWKGE